MASLDTKGYGGKYMNRAMLVTTNDASRPELRLELAGDVKPMAYISTDTVRLTGSANTEIRQTVIITPTSENPFKVTEVDAEQGEHIRLQLSEQTTPEKTVYQLTIFNTKKEKGWYMDKIHVKTDSETSPEFIISILAVIRDGS